MPRFLTPITDAMAYVAPFMAQEVRRYGELRSTLTADEADVFAGFDPEERDKPHLWALAGQHGDLAPAGSEPIPTMAKTAASPATFHTDDLALCRGRTKLDVTQDEVALLLLIQQKGAVPAEKCIGSAGQKAASIARSLDRKGLGHLIRRRRGRYEGTSLLEFKGHDVEGGWIPQPYRDTDSRLDRRQPRSDEVATEDEEHSTGF